jgi:hypothetical protein
MDREPNVEVYSADRMRRIVCLRRPDGHVQLRVEWLRSADGHRHSFSAAEAVSARVEGVTLNGLFSSAADAEAEARKIIEHEERERYAAMTVNERLWDAGLMGQFETAAKSRDRAAMPAGKRLY